LVMADIDGDKGAKVLEALTTDDALGRHCFRQPKDGYRFSIDSVLLAAFVTKTTGPVADLGAGCGVLPVLLHNRGFKGPFCCVEIDTLAAECCRHNLDQAGAAAEVLCQDLSESNPKLKRGAFTMVVSNPPFTKAGHGRISPQPSRARARQELAMDAETLWQRAAEFLCRNGHMALCWPPARLVEALNGLDAVELRPMRLRLVHGRKDKPARIALIEAVKQSRSQLEVEPPLFVYEKGRNYTAEVQAIYDSLN
jgi:tRNA1Val (adenine37-N6)-methyltransferase